MNPGYLPVLFWSLLILVSLWGYGEFLRRWVDRPEFADIGWGLTCAWGMAVVLAIGGVLMALHLAKAPSLTALVCFGAAVTFFFLAQKLTAKESKSTQRSRRAKTKTALPFTITVFSFSMPLLYALALLIFASSISWPFQIDPNDDLICYLMLPEKILQTGTLIDPFSFRRAGSFGGHWFLEALVMVVGGDRSGHVVDSGIARIILFGIAMGFPTDPGKLGIAQRWALALVALIYPIPRINTMSALTGSSSLLALAVTISKIRPSDAFWLNLRSWLPAILLAACAALMRPYFAIAAAGLLLAGWVVFVFIPRRRHGVPLGLTVGLTTAAFVLPWSIVLYISSSTPLVPPFSGNMNPLFMQTSVALGEFPSALLSYLTRPEVIPLLAVILLGIVFQASLFSTGFSFVVVLATVAVCQKMSATTSHEMPRYIVPILLPAALFAAGTFSETPFRRFLPIFILCVLMVVGNAEVMRTELSARVFGLPEQLRTDRHIHPTDPKNPGAYVKGVRALQSLVPKNERILVVLDFPYVLDFKRNQIASIDCIGAAAPGGGIPFFKGKHLLNKYLQEQGISYILCMDFDNALMLYNRPFWRNNPSPQWYYKAIWAPRFLDFMNNIDRLSDWGQILGTFANMRVIKLPTARAQHNVLVESE